MFLDITRLQIYEENTCRIIRTIRQTHICKELNILLSIIKNYRENQDEVRDLIIKEFQNNYSL